MTSVVIGGGAAGLFAAIRCAERGQRVILLEKTNQLLAKVRISGGGRCNTTHACFSPQGLVKNYPRGEKELLGPFHTFGPKETIAWFEKRGVELKTEADGRMFPTTDSSQTIIDCLLEAAKGVEIRKKARITAIDPDLTVTLGDEKIAAKRLLLATGSAKWGHEMAEHLGHTIVPPVPSLFTFNVPSSPLLDLSGIAVQNAIVSIGKQAQQGPLLLTHWGFSGPAALKLSAFAARELALCDYKATLLINWVGMSTHALLEELQTKKSLPPLPQKLRARLLEEIGIDMPLERLSKKALARLADKLTRDPYPIEGKTTYKQEFVTAGGVELKEVNFKTMESRKCPGLFFAGEILNIDGITGGFNFQNAWTTGYIAGSAM